MNELLAIAVGGALGASLRFLVARGIHKVIGEVFPFGILTVNIIGCFLMGILATLFIERFTLGPLWRAGILIGLLGGFTTFSSFTIDTLNLFESGATVMAISYVLVSVMLCLLATWLGIFIGRS